MYTRTRLSRSFVRVYVVVLTGVLVVGVMVYFADLPRQSPTGDGDRGRWKRRLVAKHVRPTGAENGKKDGMLHIRSNETRESNSGASADHSVPASLPSTMNPSTDATSSYRTRPANDDVTLVTGFFDIGRSKWRHWTRRVEDYIAYSRNVLSLNNNVVIFIDPQMLKHVQPLRMGLARRTVVRLVNLPALSFYTRYIGRIRSVMASDGFQRRRLERNPEGFSPEYNTLMATKVDLLREATRLNYFKTEYFYWIDMGYGHGNDVFPSPRTPWAPANLMDGRNSATADRVTFIELNDWRAYPDAFQVSQLSVMPAVNGGFFGGTARAVNDYYQLFTSVLEEFLGANLIDDDQTLALACVQRRPELFNMVRGGWYDVFRLFN